MSVGVRLCEFDCVSWTTLRVRVLICPWFRVMVHVGCGVSKHDDIDDYPCIGKMSRMKWRITFVEEQGGPQTSRGDPSMKKSKQLAPHSVTCPGRRTVWLLVTLKTFGIFRVGLDLLTYDFAWS